MAKKIVIEKDIRIPMRDGVCSKAICTGPTVPEKLPVMLNRTPYGKAAPLLAR